MSIRTIHKSDKILFTIATLMLILVGMVLLFVRTDVDTQPKTGTIGVVSGVVTEVFQDCGSHLVLENGRVVERGAVICDGGSYIVVDGETIRTSAGFTVAEEYYDVDISNLTPGDNVEVYYVTNELGVNELDCNDCTIEVL